MKIQNENNNWSVMGIWNEQLTFGRQEKELRKRTHVWASEIGKSFYERYLRMNAIKPDIDFDERTLRKFAAGDFFERIIGFVLMTSGLLKYDNQWCEIPEDQDHLRVVVKPDFIAGGKPDWPRIEENIENDPLLDLMPTLHRISKALVEYLSDKYPDGMKDLVYEIKSINSQVFWAKKDYLQEAYPHHKMQLFTGMKARQLPEGRLLYISKDDLTVAEFIYRLDDKKLNDTYEKDIRTMTKYIRGKQEPPKPEDIVYDPNKKIHFTRNKTRYIINGAFDVNWEIKWSNYLPTITGFPNVEKWEMSLKNRIKEKNDQLKKNFIEKNIN